MDTTHVKLDTFSDELEELFSRAPVYKRTVPIDMRIACVDDELHSVLSDGTVETCKILKGGEYVITDSEGREHVMDKRAFHALYAEESPGIWVSVERARVIDNPTGEAIEIMAIRGKIQRGDADCLIACSELNYADRYLIPKDTFQRLYSL